MSEISETKLSEWEALATAATRGPWEAWSSDGKEWNVSAPDGDCIAHRVCGNLGMDLGTDDADVAKFIAASRTAVPELIQEVRRLKDIKSTMQRIQHYASGACDMAAETRLKLINRECECELTKSHGRVFGPIPADEVQPTEGTETK